MSLRHIPNNIMFLSRRLIPFRTFPRLENKTLYINRYLSSNIPGVTAL